MAVAVRELESTAIEAPSWMRTDHAHTPGNAHPLILAAARFEGPCGYIHEGGEEASVSSAWYEALDLRVAAL